MALPSRPTAVGASGPALLSSARPASPERLAAVLFVRLALDAATAMTSAPPNDVSSTLLADAPAPDRATRTDDLEAAKAADAARDVKVKEEGTRDAQEEWLESPEHPWNWPLATKWTNTTVIAVTGFLVRSALTCVYRSDVLTAVRPVDRAHSTRQSSFRRCPFSKTATPPLEKLSP